MANTSAACPRGCPGCGMTFDPCNEGLLFSKCIDLYKSLGYTETKNFPDEYFFMFNPKTCEKVRLYYNGRVLEG